jgi:hypothetical protein
VESVAAPQAPARSSPPPPPPKAAQPPPPPKVEAPKVTVQEVGAVPRGGVRVKGYKQHMHRRAIVPETLP